jgi:hypothetical protein
LSRQSKKYSPHINQSSQVWLKNNKYLKHIEILKPPTSTERLRDTSNIFSLGGSLRLQQCFAPAGPRARNVNTSLAQKKPADFVSVQCNHYTPRKQRQLIHTSSLWSSRVCLKIWYPPKKKQIIFPKSVVLGVYGIWHTLFSDKPDVDHWIKNTAITTQEVMGGCFRRQQQATQSQLSAVRIRLESPISNTSAS